MIMLEWMHGNRGLPIVRFDSFMIRNSESIPGSENLESTETEFRSCMHDGRPRRTAAAATVDPTMTKTPSKRE